MTDTFNVLRQLTQQTLDIGEQLERGQAETPLIDTLHHLQQQAAEPVLNIILLGLTEDSFEQVIKWFCGNVFEGVQITDTRKSGYLDVTLGSAEYMVGAFSGQQKRFQAEEDFRQAVEIELGSARTSMLEPLSIALKSQDEAAPLRLLIPDNIHALLESPSLCNALTSQANVAFVVSPLNYTLSREDHEAVEIVAANVKGLWPLLIVEELDESTALREIGWWEQHTTPQQLITPKRMIPGAARNLPSFLTNNTDQQRQSYQQSFYVEKLLGAITAIQNRFIQDSGVMQNRQSKLQAELKALQQSKASDWRELNTTLKRVVDEGLYKLKKQTDEQVAEISLQQSALSLAVQAEINTLQFSDISTEDSHSMLKLTLQNEMVERIHNVALQEAFKAIDKTVKSTHCEANLILDAINQQQDAQGISHVLVSLDSDAAAIRNKLAQRLEFSINYRGEMPKRTAFTRLGESRKLFMSMAMMAMILGGSLSGMGVDLKKILSILAPLLLIGGFVYTYIQWPKEDAEKLEKELDRIRDSLASEVKRMASEIQRFIQQQMNDLIEQYKKSINEKLEAHLNQLQAAQESSVMQAREQSERKLQDVQASIRQWQSVERRIDRLRQDVQALSRQLG